MGGRIEPLHALSLGVGEGALDVAQLPIAEANSPQVAAQVFVISRLGRVAQFPGPRYLQLGILRARLAHRQPVAVFRADHRVVSLVPMPGPQTQLVDPSPGIDRRRAPMNQFSAEFDRDIGEIPIRPYPAADAIARLQHGRLNAGALQMIGSRKPGDARANDDDFHPPALSFIVSILPND